MNEAAVGHQCPECVADGKRAQRPARTAFGGTGVGRAGYVTRALIVINVLVMIAGALVSGTSALAGAGGWFGLLGTPSSVTVWGEVLGYVSYVPGGAPHGIAAGEWWRLFTAMFLHYGVLHLGLNMWVLWQLGRYLEDKLGPLRFLGLYLLAGLGGDVAAYVFMPQDQASAGASTAVFGLMMAIFVVNRRLRLDIAPLVPMLVINLIFTFSVPNISKAGHLGGLVVGGIVAAILAYAPVARRAQVQIIGTALMFAALIVVAIVRSAALVG